MLMLYFGLSFFVADLYGDVYVNFAIGVSLELIPRTVAIFAAGRSGFVLKTTVTQIS